MEDNFNHDNFEEFLQDQVRNHRMYPTDAVWREIDKKLHGEKRWPALTIAAALLVSATVLICVYFTPKPNIFTIPAANVNISTKPSSTKNILTSINPSDPFGEQKKISQVADIPNNVARNSNSQNQTQPTVTEMSRALPKTGSPVSALYPNIVSNSTENILSVPQTPAKKLQEIASTNNGIKNESAVNKQPDVVINNLNVSPNSVKPAAVAPVKDYNDRNMVDKFLQDHKDDVALHTASKVAGLKSKVSYQIYVAPSVSYRKLLEDNSIEKDNNNGGPVGLNYVADVNEVVRHKPGTGIEAGVSMLYHVTNKVRLKGGFQFNMRQYSIDAYRSNTELASIALVGANRKDTVNTLAIYRNNNGFYAAQLVNRYYQISLPVGIEWEIIGNKVIQLNVAGTIQPTYLLNRNAYLLSSNFKNYTESPGMIRQWNLNSNIEAFVSLKVGDFKWQLGPQVRYQPYSTFIREYSIREHLLDYGFKLGMSKTIK